MNQIRFPLGLRRPPQIPLGELTVLPRSLSYKSLFKRPTFKGRGWNGREGVGEGKVKGRYGERRWRELAHQKIDIAPPMAVI